MGKIPKVKFEFGTLVIGKSPRNKIWVLAPGLQKAPVGPLNVKKPRRKFEFGSLSKRKNSLVSKIWFWAPEHKKAPVEH
jgi:hypothetical protein